MILREGEEEKKNRAQVGESWGENDYVRHADGEGRRENLGGIWMLFELHIFAFTFYFKDNNDQSSREFPSRDSRLGLCGDI